jgi:hypothetical protein
LRCSRSSLRHEALGGVISFSRVLRI